MINAFAALAALECEHPAMKSAPDHKVPRCAVPESADKHCDNEVRVCPGEAELVAAYRNVKIFAQPRGKRDVPTPPEIGDRLREIRRIKIFSENETEHQAEPNRHVGVTAEIEINLERIRERSEPRVERLNRASVKCRVRDLTAGIG